VHDWTPEDDAILGTISDHEIARRMGLSWYVVRARRVKLGIPTYSKSQSATRIPPEAIKKLNELAPFIVEEFQRRGVPVRTVTHEQIIEFLIDQALVSAKRQKMKALYSHDRKSSDDQRRT